MALGSEFDDIEIATEISEDGGFKNGLLGNNNSTHNNRNKTSASTASTSGIDGERRSKSLKRENEKKNVSSKERLPHNTTSGRPAATGSSEIENETLVKEFVTRLTKGFVRGAGLYAGFKVITALLRNPFRKSTIPVVWQGICSRDCLAVASFLGLYPSVYHLLVKLIARNRVMQDGWTYGIAGGLGGLTVALLNRSQRQTLAFFTLSRALGAGISTLVSRGFLTSVPFFEVYVFCACVSAIVYCVAMAPGYLNQGYYRSVLKWSRDYDDSKLTKLFRTPGRDFLTCADVGLHEGSCFNHRVRDLFESLPGFAKLYLPIHLVPILIFKRNLLWQRPGFVFNSLAKNLATSTSFLGMMVFLAKVTICVLRNASGRPPPLAGYIPAAAGAVCGLALMLERSNRRKELSLFVIPHFLSILYTRAQKSPTIRPLLRLPHGFTLVFALSMSSVMHAYEREPNSLTLLINGVLRFFFGPSASSLKPEPLPTRMTETSKTTSAEEIPAYSKFSQDCRANTNGNAQRVTVVFAASDDVTSCKDNTHNQSNLTTMGDNNSTLSNGFASGISSNDSAFVVTLQDNKDSDFRDI